jgi:hypothetical protein
MVEVRDVFNRASHDKDRGRPRLGAHQWTLIAPDSAVEAAPMPSLALKRKCR